jgi:DNA repair exonuclease SbcCD ATPase subunit
MTNSTPGRPPPGKEYDTMNDEPKKCPFCGSENHPYHKEDCFIINAHYSTIEAYNTRPLEDALRSQLADAHEEIKRLVEELEVFNDTLANNEEYCASMSQALLRAQAEIKRLQEALTGLGYTPSADDSGSYDSLIPDEYL